MIVKTKYIIIVVDYLQLHKKTDWQQITEWICCIRSMKL